MSLLSNESRMVKVNKNFKKLLDKAKEETGESINILSKKLGDKPNIVMKILKGNKNGD